MSSNNYLHLYLKLRISDEQTKLLTGLDELLKLGLISEEDIKEISLKYLTCALPITKTLTNPIQAEGANSLVPFKPISKKPSPVSLAWSNLREELSIRWLLMTGIFLVIISSGVLAAGSWQEFSVIWQYGILEAYTLAFWGIGIWLARNPSLPLTASSLQKVSLLLIPINFWAMDTLGLSKSIPGIVSMIISSLILTGVWLWQNRHGQSLSSSYNFLTLSYFHWGWRWMQFPLIAIYFGGAISFFVLRFISPNRAVGVGFIVYAYLVILIRAIFVVQIPLSKLGLVLGIGGWLLQNHQISGKIKFLSPLGGFIILFIALIATREAQIPWQAVIITGLALHRSFDYLQRYWQKRYLLLIILLGAQGCFLLERLIPLSIRKNVLSGWIEFTGRGGFPQSIYSVSWFFYVFALLLLVDWLYQQDKLKLARLGERISLGVGLMLTIVSLSNPVARSLHLILATITLVFWSYRRQNSGYLRVYFAHIVGLIAIFVNLTRLLPQLNISQWAVVITFLAVSEFVIHGIARNLSFRDGIIFKYTHTAWLIGFILAGIGYFGFWFHTNISTEKIRLVWLFIPLTLTLIAHRYSLKKQITAAKYSAIALIIAQLLYLGNFPCRIIGLAVASGLMFINSKYLPQQWVRLLHIGFILGLTITLLSPSFSLADWWLAGVMLMVILLLSASLLTEYYPSYATAARLWGIFIGAGELVLLTIKLILLPTQIISPSGQALAALVLFFVSVGYIYRHETDTKFDLGYVLAWLLELILIEIVTLTEGSRIILAAANLGLAVISLGLVRYFTPRLKIFLPLFYGGIALASRWGYFTAYTGLLTLGIGLISWRVSYLNPRYKWLVYVSLSLVDLGIYEIILYQILPLTLGIKLTIIALTTGMLAIIYLVAAWFCEIRGDNQYLNLSVKEIKLIANIHWISASLIQLGSVLFIRETSIDLIFFIVVVTLLIASYAFTKGRFLDSQAVNWWIYVGILEIIATSIYLRLIWQQLRILDPWLVLVIVVIAWIIYQLPWLSWGWQPTPWQRSAALLPTVAVLTTNPTDINLITVALFYLYLALQQGNIRLVYLSLGFFDWAIARWLFNQGILNLLIYSLIVGLTILYIARVDPWLKLPQQKSTRHYLRLFGFGMIGIVALLFHQKTVIIPVIIALFGVFWGLLFKIRAFLYVGSCLFTLTIFYQLIVLSFTYSFLKWIIGLVMGILFISVAANFERRREQIMSIWENWLTQLNQWA